MSENNKLTIEEALAATAGAIKTWIEENPDIGSSGSSIYVFMGDVREDYNSDSDTGRWSESKLRNPTNRKPQIGDLVLDFSNNLCSISSVFDDGTFNLAYIHNIGTGGGSTDGSIKIEDDGEGNVTITTASGGKINITDDGNGNVTIGG